MHDIRDDAGNSKLDTVLTTKPWYLSKGVVAALATIIQGFLLVVFKLDLTHEDMSLLTGVIVGGGTVVTGAISLYSRLKPTNVPVTLRKQPTK